jgi:superfamily II DNA or RNA helicase
MATKARPMAHVKLWTSLDLWPHQKQAAVMVQSYLGRDVGGAAALVRMPTGTGKTRVIATVTRCMPEIKNSLVVCPYLGLRDQLKRDIASNVESDEVTSNAKWAEEINKDWPRDVRVLTPSSLRGQLKKSSQNGTVFVATVQTLQHIHTSDPKGYAALQKSIDAVVVDEGHREPAPEWAAAVRGLQKHTVLFTATPYRNDHLIFQVSRDFVYAFTHQEAEQQNYVRRVDFTEKDLSRTTKDFVKELIKLYEGTVKPGKPSGVVHPRVIVRCETKDSVSKITKHLRSMKQTALGIHDRFKNRQDGDEQRSVPDPKKHAETFWVHQFKLLEGIDEPAFCLLAVYEPLRNARSLVQQVGRVIRNPGTQTGQAAYVLCRTGDGQKDYWDGYRDYEKQFERNPQRYEIREIFDVFSQMQPAYQYYDRDYRVRFDFKENDNTPPLHEDFQFRKSAIVFEASDRLDWSALEKDITDEWAASDADVRHPYKPDEKTLLLPYVAARNSRVLRSHAITEMELGYTIVRKSNGYIFFFDSQGRSAEALLRFPLVHPARLENLFSGKQAKLSNISLINTDIGRHSTRRRTIQAFSIAQTAPNLLDYAHFPSAVTGYSQDGPLGRRRRYIGLKHSRISDQSQMNLDFEDYRGWIDDVGQQLRRSLRPLSIFDRYAMYSTPPKDTTPRNILLDISDVMDKFYLIDQASGKKPKRKKHPSILLDVEDICFDVDKDGQFTLPTNSGHYQPIVSYEPARKRYMLTCPELEKAYESDSTSRGRNPENLVHYLNRTQTFRVVPGSSDRIYAHGLFYQPRYPLTGPKSTQHIDLLTILTGSRDLAEMGSEKGGKGSSTPAGWAKGSLFNLIATLGQRTDMAAEFVGIDLLVCDDMQTEVADFIAADTTRKRVIFIHAKARGGRLSASVLQDVCGQATKNLYFLTLNNDRPPSNLKAWNGPWNGGRIGKVEKRIIHGVGDGPALWSQIHSLLRNPSTEREVWILLGDTLSREAFDKERRKDDPSPETIQILFLLQSTWGAVNSVGAVFRVFCS